MNTLLSLLLFVIALGVLITIHELGHFITAKSFKVYCSDFSIGFGYKILKIGRKDPDEKKSSLFFIESKNPKRETTFSLGVVPLGGYVAMLGEDDDEVIKDSPELKGRSLEDISYWKKIIIMFAGIFMNFVLAFVIYFISASCFEQKGTEYVNMIQVTNQDEAGQTLTYDLDGKSSVTLSSPITGDDNKATTYYFFQLNYYNTENRDNQYTLNDPAYPVKISGKTENYCLVFDTSGVGYNDTDYSLCVKVALAEDKGNNGKYYPVLNEKGAYEYYNFEGTETIEPIKVMFSKTENGVSNVEKVDCYLNLKVKSDKTFERFGVGVYVYSYWNGWNSFKVAGENWWDSTKLIGRSLASLFYSSETWGQLGGPVAIFTQTTSILQSYPFYVYLNTWGMISVNLALFNLLPFPGLDGWQILVTVIEAITNGFKKSKFKKEHKKEVVATVSDKSTEVEVGDKPQEEVYKEWKFPPKVKNVISYIGLFLLFGLMIVIFIKDIVGLF